MKTLRKGDRSPEVRTLHQKLSAMDYPLAPADLFSAKTDNAVRNFQRKNKLLPDGVVGAKTWLALDTKQTAKTPARPVTPAKPFNPLTDWLTLLGALGVQFSATAKTAPPSLELSRPVSLLKTSEKGLQFIYTREAWSGRSNILHWPGGGSGVTLGPGYDMKERTEESIAKDMQAIGQSADIAKKIAKGAGLKGDDAKKFVKDNNVEGNVLVQLSDKNELELLKLIVPAYEAHVKRRITIDLLQHEFDALVSFAWQALASRDKNNKRPASSLCVGMMVSPLVNNA